MRTPERSMESRVSAARRAGYVKQSTAYVAFHVAPFPPGDLEMSSALISSLSQADQALARRDGAASVIPNVNLFITMHIRDEAARSSQIEGTQATLADVVEAEIHAELMSGVRGGTADRTPGEFRRSQNWIGGSSPSNARFVPPPVEQMHAALHEWEVAIHTDDDLPVLVKIGLLHAQFETIHPFIDGDWEGWLVFFLDGVTDTAAEAATTVRAILDLRERDRQRISQLGHRAADAYRLHDRLFSAPLTTAADVQRTLDVSRPSER